MSSPVNHTTFTIVRDLPGSPRHAFRFWSEPELKRRWNDCHADWTVLESGFDFREGGSEVSLWRMPEGQTLGVRTHYFSVVPAKRIVYAYEMSLDAVSVSTSLVTVEFSPGPKGTTMTFTEQAAFLDGSDPKTRQIGTNDGFDRLVAVIEQENAVQH
ncbi:SRPBCC family protein [Paradevosia shaoguanensis]|uniref:SRPBCC family protein n=1 Tax=Paradevosia shaoguanensis TaxID=1335043 RepID=UPI001932E1E7|nr:SRPBCC family protein [Paradevosia shaoguanensis]